MRISSVMTILSVFGVANGYVIQIYPEKDCKGEPKRVNVWRDSCADKLPTFQSIVPVDYGIADQRAIFYGARGCHTFGDYTNQLRVDGTEYTFKLNQCLNIGFDAHAAGSYFKNCFGFRNPEK